MRLCRLRTSRNTLRAVVAQFGSEGCVLLLKKSVYEMPEVVGSTNGKGILGMSSEVTVVVHAGT